MGQLLGGIVAIWWLSLLINFIIMQTKKQESRETRLTATISAVLFAVVVSTFVNLSSEVVTTTDIMGSIIAYLVGGVVIYFSYVRRFKNSKDNESQKTEKDSNLVELASKFFYGFIYVGVVIGILYFLWIFVIMIFSN